MSRRVVLNRPLHIYETGSTVEISKGALIAYDSGFLALNGDIGRSEVLIEQEINFSAAIVNAAASVSADDGQLMGKDPETRHVQELLQVKSVFLTCFFAPQTKWMFET
jgi:hypothetical protein